MPARKGSGPVCIHRVNNMVLDVYYLFIYLMLYGVNRKHQRTADWVTSLKVTTLLTYPFDVIR